MAKAALKERLKAPRDQALFALLDHIEDYKKRRYLAPLHDAINHLPKDELAHVASSLVNLNSFKKRMSLSLETVGGPVDVAVISKGDGFIWIERKHYFDKDLNPQFFKNWDPSSDTGTERPDHGKITKAPATRRKTGTGGGGGRTTPRPGQ